MSIQTPRPKNPKSASPEEAAALQKKLSDAVTEETAKHPERSVEVFASDEHRLGLKPVTRRVRAPIGERPIAPGHHRFGWLYVTAFVSPASGETFWYVHDGASKRSSRRCSKPSHARPAPAFIEPSFSSSTTPDDMAKRASTFQRA